MAEIGDAFIEVHADTKPFHEELPGQLDDAADLAEGKFNKTGQKIGDDVSDGIGVQLKKRAKTFAKSIEDGTKNTVVRIRSIFRFDRIKDSISRAFRRDAGRSVGQAVVDEVADAFDKASRKGGVFSKIGSGVADAIGAGFNISGRSPLIALLIPALAALLGLILAAVQAVNALVAVLLIIPGLLASIGLQVGVVAIAFQGMGEAVQKAFAAKNAKELKEALKGLTPSARSFVGELLKLRPLFKEIGRVVQENFFKKLTGVITAIRTSLGPSLIKGFGQLASAMGQFFEDFGLLLASPGFKNFFNKLIPATARWLDKFGMSLFGDRGFVTALIDMATELMPFMEKFGDVVLRNLDTLAALLFRIGTDPRTTEWLDSMAATLQLVFDLLFSLGEFLFVFFSQLDKAGGKGIFTELIKVINLINFFLASPAGLKAMEGLINLGIIGIRVTSGLILAILGVVAAFEFLAEWLKNTAIPAIIADVKMLVQILINMATFLSVWIDRIVGAIQRFFIRADQIGTQWRNNTIGFVKAVLAWLVRFFQELGKIPSKTLAKFANFGSLLINAGRSLINGLINGIRQKMGELFNLIGQIAGKIGGFFGASPAKEGPLSGRGWTMYRGQRMMQDLIEGIQAEVPNLREASMNATSNIIFGSNSVQVNVSGDMDQNQARTVGAAMGMSAANMIAARNTRLAVRTI